MFSAAPRGELVTTSLGELESHSLHLLCCVEGHSPFDHCTMLGDYLCCVNTFQQ